jgi:FkbM family methyltransferase
MNTPERFWDVFEATARAVLQGEHSPTNEMEKVVTAASSGGRIAFYPCNRYSRKILNFFEKYHLELLGKVVAVFDKSNNLNFRKDIPVFMLDRFLSMDIDRLIVTTSKFPDDLLPDLDAVGVPREMIFMTSLFREELSHIKLEEILEKVKKVTEILTDTKSRMTYLLTWISLLLLDKDMLSLYSLPADLAYRPDGKVSFHGIELTNIHELNIQYSLFLEIYRMEHVFPERGDIILDIGAYRGDTMAYFRKYIGDTGAVYAFEPDEINFKYLVENIERNNLKNIFPIKCALFNRKTTCNLISTPESGSFLFIIKDEVDTDKVTQIEATTVDDFVRSAGLPKVDFIKSDIEGCELEMLEGARETISRFNPKMALAIYHSITDLLNIPLKVHEMNPDYELYIRQHNFVGSPWEILMFTRARPR